MKPVIRTTTCCRFSVGFAHAPGILVMITALLSVLGCSSAPVADDQAAGTAAPAAVPPNQQPLFRAWEVSTREQADDLLAEADRMVSQGDHRAALDRIDEALCLVLEPPEGYAGNPEYLDFVARLLAEAEALEDNLVGTGDMAEPQELVALPPIDVPEIDADLMQPVDPNALPDSEYPLVRNTTVERFLEAMTSDGEYRERIETGLGRSGDYLPMIRGKLTKAGLPVELSYLPLIESAFSVKAYSRARAHGMWQFIASTGRHYGLEIGSLVDERRDPVRSTDAAVAYLSDLYREFDDWHLALAAYNSGSGNVRRAVRRSGSRDFWTLRRHLPRETRNYVPAFIASVIIAKEPDRWGFPVPDEKPWGYDRVEVPDALDLEFLADRTGLSADELRRINPAIRRDLTPANQVTSLWLPPGTASDVSRLLESVPSSEWAPRMIHTVRRGESLYTIARRYSSSVGAIKQANGLRRNLIHPGQSLVVPRLGVSYAAPPQRSAQNGSYVVQPNDTLWDIARAFGISVDSLCAANGTSRNQVIRPGQRLLLPDGSSSMSVGRRSAAAPASWSDTYTVRRGDTLSGIAQRFGVTVTELRRANGLTSSRIYPGNALSVPSLSPTAPDRATVRGATTYRVRKGDTLYDIARQFGVSVNELRRLNGLASSRIYPGDVLRIPKKQAKG
jgi:membrane-bound lytic murein transglycosylase D